MIKELYIDGYLVDIDDNFDIVRQYSSPFFSDVSQLKNNASYSTKIPDTENNRFVMDYLFREDSDTTFPYRVHKANYYVNSFPVFENAEVRVIDDFELQFVWGLNRGKYLPLFEKKLNEIVPNETTILSSDWYVTWKKANVIYATGKKYKYLNYVSGERESEVKIIDGVEQPLTQAPEPYLSNLKEMTMHPFIEFNNILDLITFGILEQTFTTEIYTLTTTSQTFQNELQFSELVNEHIKIGDLVTELYGVSLPSETYPNDIYVEGVGDFFISFSEDVSDGFSIGQTVKIQSSVSEFDFLKQRLTNKGIILSGNDDDIDYSVTLDVSGLKTSSLVLSNPDYSKPVIFYYSNFNTGWNYSTNVTVEISIEIQDIVTQIQLIKGEKSSGENEEIILSINPLGLTEEPLPQFPNNVVYYKTINFDVEKEYYYYFKLIGIIGSGTANIEAGSYFKFDYHIKESLYASNADGFTEYGYGRYNCLINLPEITAADFINEMLKMTGLFIGHDADGNMKFLSLDTFKSNLLSGNIYDWSGKVSGKEKSYFQFNSNAQKNWIKFTNSDDRTYTAKDYIPVDDTTLDSEKDLYTVSFDLPEKASSGIAEFILYKQKVASSEKDVLGTPTEVKSFSQDYNEKPSVCVYDSSGTAIIENVLPNGTSGFVTPYYDIYKKIIYRPRVVDIVVKLDFLETLEIDFEKPIYISDYGKYAVLLDIKIPDDGLCNAKILLINQTL